MQFDKKQFMAAVAPAFAIAAKQHVVPAAGFINFVQSKKEKGQGVAIVNAGAHAVACRFKVDDYFTSFCVDGAPFQTALSVLPDGHVHLDEGTTSVKSKGSVKITVPTAAPGPSLPTMPAELPFTAISAADLAKVSVALKFCHMEELHTLSSVYINNGRILASDGAYFAVIDCDSQASVAIQKTQIAHLPPDDYDIGQEPSSGRLWLKNDHVVNCSVYTGQYSLQTTTGMLDALFSRLTDSGIPFKKMDDATAHFLEKSTKIVGATDWLTLGEGTMSVENSISGIKLEADFGLGVTARYSASKIQKCMQAHSEAPEIGFFGMNGGYIMILKSPGIITGCQSIQS